MISCYNVDVHNAPHVSAVELLVHLLVAKRSSCVNEVLGEDYDIVLQHFKPVKWQLLDSQVCYFHNKSSVIIINQ